MTLIWDENRPKHRQQQLDDQRKLEILRQAHWGVLSTVNPDGEPYGVPIGFAWDDSDNSLIFHTSNSGMKVENLRRDDRVCFSVVGSSDLISGKFSAGYESIVIFGHVSRVEDPAEALRTAVVYCRKFAPKIIEGMNIDEAEMEINDMAQMIEKSAGQMSMYRLTPTHIDGKRRQGPAKRQAK